jgi:hypothetical protein
MRFSQVNMVLRAPDPTPAMGTATAAINRSSLEGGAAAAELELELKLSPTPSKALVGDDGGELFEAPPDASGQVTPRSLLPKED